MKVVLILLAVLAVSLAAPSEVPIPEKEVPVAEKSEDSGKVVEKEEAVPPVVVVATSAEEKKTDEDLASEEEKQNSKLEYGAICRASTGATEEQITAIGKDPIDDAPKPVKCYIKCLAEEYGIEKDQVLQMDVALRHRPSTITVEEYKTIAETCAEVLAETDDPCDSAYLRYSCFFRASGEKIRIA